MQVIITRPADDAAAWLEQLQATSHWSSDWTARLWPLIDIRPLPLVFDANLPLEGTFDAAMFVSANAVRFGLRPLARAGAFRHDAQAWAVGPSTRQALLDEGWSFEAIISPDGADGGQFDSEALWQLVQPQVRAGAVRQVLLVKGSQQGADGKPIGRDWLGEQLQAEGVDVAQVAVYERVLPLWTPVQQAAARAALGDGSVWLISSSMGALQLPRLLAPVSGADSDDAMDSDEMRAMLARARAVASHPRIAESLLRQGWGRVHTSEPGPQAVAASIESMTYAR